MRDENPRDIRDQRAAILETIGQRDAHKADALARERLLLASAFMVSRLKARGKAAGEETSPAAAG